MNEDNLTDSYSQEANENMKVTIENLTYLDDIGAIGSHYMVSNVIRNCAK